MIKVGKHCLNALEYILTFYEEVLFFYFADTEGFFYEFCIIAKKKKYRIYIWSYLILVQSSFK